nr:DUF4365 domain-containing protein [Mycoplana dimorpha]
MKKRSRNARQGRAGVIAVEQACNRLDLIWRNLLEEDVGVDGTIEIALGEFPTGKIVGAQIKSGMSYIRSETSTSFRFYPIVMTSPTGASCRYRSSCSCTIQVKAAFTGSMSPTISNPAATIRWALAT